MCVWLGQQVVHRPLPTPIQARRLGQNHHLTPALTQSRNHRALAPTRMLHGHARKNGMTRVGGREDAVSPALRLVGDGTGTAAAAAVRLIDCSEYPHLGAMPPSFVL